MRRVRGHVRSFSVCKVAGKSQGVCDRRRCNLELSLPKQEYCEFDRVFMFRQRIVGTRIKLILNRLYKLAQNPATTGGVKRFDWYYRLNASQTTLAQKAF